MDAETRDLLSTARSLGVQIGSPIFLAGGCVRDLLDGKTAPINDIDLVLEGDAIYYAERLSRKIGGALKKFPNFLTAKILDPAVHLKIKEIDVAAARCESYPHPGALPLVQPGKIEEDLARRDFAVNAMALRLSNYLQWIDSGAGVALLKPQTIDLFGGLEDLQARLIRVLHDGSFIDDPTRVFRACRYAVRIAGRLEAGTLHLLQSAVLGGCLETVSATRKMNELKKVLSEEKPHAVLQLLDEYGVLNRAFGISRSAGRGMVEAVQRVADLQVKDPGGFRFKIMLRIFGKFTEGEQWKSFLRAAGLGNREIKEIQSDLEEADQPRRAEDLSNGALVLQQVFRPRADGGEYLLDEAKRRGLLKEADS